MDFAGFVGGPEVFVDAHISARKHLKGVSRFVREDVNIATCAVEIRENVGCFVLADEGAIAARCLSVFRFQVHEVVLAHEFKKFIGVF